MVHYAGKWLAGRAAVLRERLGPRLTVRRLTLGLIGLGMLWRVLRYVHGFPIWGDEAFVAVNFITRGYADMIRPLEYGQIVPLVFMWAELAASRLLGLSEHALRLLPTLAAIASVVLFWRFARDVLPARPAMLAVGILAASYYHVRHGAEVKPYATDMLVSLVLTMLAWGVFQWPDSGRHWAGLTIFAAAAVWCSYPAAFVGGAVGLLLAWLVIRERLRLAVLADALRFCLVLGCSFLVMYVVYAKPHADYAARLTEINMWAKTFPPLDDPWKLVKWLVGIHTGLMLAYPHGGTAPGSLATFLLVVIGTVRLARNNGPLVVLLLGPLVFTLVAAALKAYPYGGSVRTSLYMAPAFCLLAGLGLFTVLRWLRGYVAMRPALQVSAAALAVIPIVGMLGDATRPYQSLASHKSRQAVQTIARQTGVEDRWVVFNAIERVDYAPYLGDWRGVGGQFVFDVLRYHPVPLTWAPPPESVEPSATGRVWLLSYRGPKVPFPEDQLTQYLDRLAARLGPATHQRFVIKTKKEGVEALDVYLFGPRLSAGGA